MDIQRRETACSFLASGVGARFGDCFGSLFTVTPVSAQRTRASIACDTAGSVKVLWPLQGTVRVRQGRHDSLVHPQQWIVYDTTREYALELNKPGRFVVLMLPQAAYIGWTEDLRDVCGRTMTVSGVSRILLAALQGMLSESAPLDSQAASVMQDCVFSLLRCALRGNRPQSDRRLGNDGHRLLAIQEYIAQCIGNPALTPESVAQACGMSRRSLYNLFLAAGDTPAAFIQAARLQAASRLLHCSEHCERSITDIAIECGFSDMSHFSRAFRQRFGCSPSAWRTRVAF